MLFKRLSKVLLRTKLFRNNFRILSRPFQKANFLLIYELGPLGSKKIGPGYIVIPTFIIDPLIAPHKKIVISSYNALPYGFPW